MHRCHLADAGLAWRADSQTRTVAVHRPEAEAETFLETDILDCPALLPEFSLPVVEIFTI